MRDVFVLVGGPPASGKSTLAGLLAPALDLPLLAKDTLKHALFDALGEPDDLGRSRLLGRAAVLAMLAAAAQQRGAVLDSTWYPYTLEHVRALPSPIVEVRCVCPPAVLRDRYRARMPARRAGDLQQQRPPAELLDPAHSRPLGVGPPIPVDTARRIDVAALAARILHLQASTPNETTAP